MKYIYVLEDDPKLQGQLYEAIRKTEPASQVRFFSSLEAFQKWIVVALQDGQASLFRGGEKCDLDLNPLSSAVDPSDELTLLISKDEWLGSRYLPLLKKTVQSFIRKKICSESDPTRLVLTAFEGPDFDLRQIMDPAISNIFFKPFDPLILDQQLHYALKGHHPPSQAFVHKVQTSEEVEMTKEAHLEAVGDVGFVTRSPREIQVGQVSKYYGDAFRATGRIHVMARCLGSEKHPDIEGEFRVWFSYFGIPSSQISEIRRNLAKKNEPGFGSQLKVKPQKNETDWVILDPDRDRVTKYKKLAEDLFKARVQVFKSFESFFFQSDPIAKENAQKEKAWADFEKITLRFDPTGEFLKEVLPEGVAAKKLFGESWAAFKKHSFFSRLHEKSISIWRQAVSNGKWNIQELLLVQNAGFFFTVQPQNLKKVTLGKDTFLEVELAEPPIHIRMNWYQKNFKSPFEAGTFLIAEEYLNEEKLPFWLEYLAQAQKKSSETRYLALFSKQPDEKFIRQLGWITDVFDETNESAYIERKLAWLGGSPKALAEQSEAPFLRDGKELIRVANPVEVAELSEAGLVINYYREIEVGAYRKFVFARRGESFIEDLAVCNFSVVHPTEKELFQCHFVFFGSTDDQLKSIRLWILENYVQSKQEEG
jgi:hypothetical protein